MPDLAAIETSPHAAALLLKCVDFISDTVLVTDAWPIDSPGPRVVFVNAAFERMTGYRASEIVGQSPRLLQGPKTDRAELQRIRTELGRWHPIRAELINYRKNGEEFVVEMDIVPISDGHGGWTHWVAIQRDVTARKKAEADARAREAQRHESLGTLLSGIAHDFNNIIAAILGNVAIASLDMRAGQMPHASIEQIKTAALRARSVVAKILAYSRRSSEATAPLQLAPIAREAVDLLRAILHAGVRLELSGPREPLWVEGDASQLCQVFLNLGINALQALEGREGTIHFTLAAGVAPAKEATHERRRTAEVEVSDDGCGMDAATQARIFEPYFTTKQNGRGTGLGLSVAWGIVTAHQGAITVASEPGRGSRITVSLPLMPEEAPGKPATPSASLSDPPSPPEIYGRGERVLVVDDDEVVVLMLEGMLQRWGFEVTTLQDPLQAVALLQEAPNAFDIVVTDLNMPQVSGLQLAREVLAIRGDMPVLLGSGTVSDALVVEATQAGIAAVFPKEFAVEQLGPLLQATLVRPARAQPPQPAPSTRPPGPLREAAPPPPHPKAAPLPRKKVAMQGFLSNNRDELVARCKSKVAERPHRSATDAQLANGVPLLIDQLIRTLTAEAAGEGGAEGLTICGPAGGDALTSSEIGTGATTHGQQLLELGYTIDQVVHDYGDLCQAITDLAVERDAPFSVDAYRTLNRCLDNAIANAVTGYAAQRDIAVRAAQATEELQRLGFFAHELRNYLQVAMLAFNALETGGLAITGSTGAVLKRNLRLLEGVIGQTLSEVREASITVDSEQVFVLASFIGDAAAIASLYADEAGCKLRLPMVDPRLAIRGNRDLLLAALGNLLQNAFKFTRPNTDVILRAHAAASRILIEVSDHCGGLPPGAANRLFAPFKQARQDARGLGLGLAIATQSVAADGGRLSVRDIPAVGCTFTIDLPDASSPVQG